MAQLREQPSLVWGLKAVGTDSGARGWNKKETGMESWSGQKYFELSHNFSIFGLYEDVSPYRQYAPVEKNQ